MGDDSKPTVRDRPSAPTIPGAPDWSRHAHAPVTGRYESGEEIARGGMGRVVEATDTLLGRVVAVKEALTVDPEGLRRFAREMRITARLEHPSIVPVYDAGTLADGSPYYVMRKVSGRPLEELIAELPSLDERLAVLPHVCAAAQAVAHAHERGIIHRDLKPSNILVGTLGETVVIDWGLAKVIGELDEVTTSPAPDAGGSLRTRIGTVLGTPGFMAPEQINANDVDERADVYALGATLYFLLARKPPHAAATGDDMIEAATKGPPTPIASMVAGVPPELSTIVDKALSYDARLRYADAGALAGDLQRFLAGQLVASHHYSRVTRLRRFVRRNRVAVAIASIALVVVGAGAWLAVSRVVAARDLAMVELDAAELAHQREADRANQLTLSEARVLVESDPTAAMALLKPLAGSVRWREARAIAAGARARGVPYAITTSDKTKVIDISPSGEQGLSTGGDGVIRLYQLRTRVTRIVTHIDDARIARFIDETHIAVLAPEGLSLIDLTTGATRAVALPVFTLQSIRGVLYGATEGTLYSLDRDGAWTVRAVVDDKILNIAASIDGSMIALAGHEHLWLVDDTGVEPLADGHIDAIAWSDTEARLLATTSSHMFDVTLAPVRSIKEGPRNGMHVGLGQGHIYDVGPRTVIDGVALDPAQLGEMGTVELGRARDGVMITAQAGSGRLVIHDANQHIDVECPIPRVDFIFASRRSSYFFTVGRDEALLWNLDDIIGHHQAMPRHSISGSIGDVLLVAPLRGTSRWIDLRDGSSFLLDALVVNPEALSATGATVVGVDLTAREAQVARRGQPHVERFGERVTAADLLDDDRAVLGTSDGVVELYDLATHKVTPLASHPARIIRIRHAGPAILATYADHVRWRGELTGHSTTLTIASPEVAVPTSDGSVWFAEGTHLRQWHLDGTVTDQAILPKPIEHAWLADDRHVILDSGDETYLVDLDTKNHFMPTLRLGVVAPVRLGDGLTAVLQPAAGLTILDASVNAWWSLSRYLARSMLVTGAPEGVITLSSEEYEYWDLELPRSAEATHRWIEQLTNAVYDPMTGVLSWRR